MMHTLDLGQRCQARLDISNCIVQSSGRNAGERSIETTTPFGMAGRLDVLVEFGSGEDGDRLIHESTILSDGFGAMLEE